MRQVGRSVQCRQNRRGRTAATWPFLMSDAERTPSWRRRKFRPAGAFVAIAGLPETPGYPSRFFPVYRPQERRCVRLKAN